MGNRLDIQIEGVKFAQIYAHWGDTPHFIEELRHFNTMFLEKRGFDDPEYKMAALLRWLGASDEAAKREFLVTGYGIQPFNCGAGDRLVILKADGSILEDIL